jgi:ubiquinone/menaquinone biosynthesis C-methylase UbiE
MSITKAILMQMFGCPRGLLGRLGGPIMARTNAKCGKWVSDQLEIVFNDCVLEVGFGPGVTIDYLSTLTPAGRIAGIDQSKEMYEQARALNMASIKSGHVDLRCGSVDSLPFDDHKFDAALAINSMQVWPDVQTGFREIRRVMKPGAKIAIGFTPYSGRSKDGLTETLAEAGFTQVRLVEETDVGFCVLGTKP